MARTPPAGFLLKAIVIGLGGLIAAPTMVALPAYAFVMSERGGSKVGPISWIFALGGAAILWLAIRALRRTDDDGERWTAQRLLRLALVPCLLIGLGAATYVCYRAHQGHRFLVERDARYLCDKLGRHDAACLPAAEKCRRLHGGMESARSTARDAECLECLRLAPPS